MLLMIFTSNYLLFRYTHSWMSNHRRYIASTMEILMFSLIAVFENDDTLKKKF